MEPPSASPHRGRVHWQGSLLTVSLLIFWSPSIPAQPAIESVPLNAAEGNDVLLLLQNPPENIFIYIWYKGESAGNNNRIVSYTPQAQVNDSGPAYTGRETIYHNGSLLFQNVTLNHTGVYTLQISTILGVTQIAGQIRVYQSVTKPSIQASNTTVTENEGPVTLTCLTNHAEISIRWIFKGQILPLTERTTLSQDNSSLTIDPVRREDTGEYQCEVYNPVSSNKSDLLNLTVTYYDSAPESSGLSGGAIAGIVVGAVAVVAVVVALVYFLCIRNTAGLFKLP